MRYAFNTLTFIKRLETTGINYRQAEVLTEGLTNRTAAVQTCMPSGVGGVEL